MSMSPEKERCRLSLHSPFQAQIGRSQLSPLINSTSHQIFHTRRKTASVLLSVRLRRAGFGAPPSCARYFSYPLTGRHLLLVRIFDNLCLSKRRYQTFKVAFTHVEHCLHGCFVRTEWYTEKSLDCYKDKVMI